MIQLQIFDPAAISDSNPSGMRPAAQQDLDQLVRTKFAFFHLVAHLRVLVPQLLSECDQINAGTWQDDAAMTPDQQEVQMKVAFRVVDVEIERAQAIRQNAGGRACFVRVTLDDIGRIKLGQFLPVAFDRELDTAGDGNRSVAVVPDSLPQ
jgi:hypothetical protein